MFSKLKDIKDLRSQAKKMQEEMSKEVIENQKHGISITMNGNQEILKFTLPADALSSGSKERLEKNIVEAFDDTLKKLQRRMAEKMMKGKDISDIQLPGF